MAYILDVQVDGLIVLSKSVNYPWELDEELIATALRHSKPPIRYPIDPDTGLLDLAHPGASPVVRVRIWDPQREGGTWVGADGLTTAAVDGWLPVEVTVHVGSVNK